MAGGLWKRWWFRYGFLPLLLLVLLLFVRVAAEADGLKDFTSDGCSLFPDRSPNGRTDWCSCCFQHDILYWQGGTREQRKRADELLRQCILEKTGSKALAATMYRGVRAGGHPAFPTWYRWAYGWPYGRGYKPLTDKEASLAKKKLENYRSSSPTPVCK